MPAAVATRWPQHQPPAARSCRRPLTCSHNDVGHAFHARGMAQGSTTDPALLAAILESLKTNQPDGSHGMSAVGRLLCRNLSEADPALAGQLRQRRAAQLHVSHDGITYFEHSDDDFPLALPSFQVPLCAGSLRKFAELAAAGCGLSQQAALAQCAGCLLGAGLGPSAV